MGQYFQPVLSNTDSRDKFVEGVFAKVYSHDHDNGLKLMEHSYIGNAVPGIVMAALAKRPARVVWAGDYADEEPDGTIIYSLANKLPEPEVGPQEYRYLVNLDRGVFVDLEAVGDDGEGYKIHPLPLLTAEGNGRGGGDFRGENVHLGTWAREQLAATDVYPNGLDELVPDFQES